MVRGGLQRRVHSPRKRAGTSSVPEAIADAPKVVWAMDFQFDSTVDGKAIIGDSPGMPAYRHVNQ